LSTRESEHTVGGVRRAGVGVSEGMRWLAAAVRRQGCGR
jgi:hypothetical protein